MIVLIMMDRRVSGGVGLTIFGIIVWAFFGFWYVAVQAGKSDGFVAASAYGPAFSSHGLAGILLIVGVILTAIGLGVAISGVRRANA